MIKYKADYKLQPVKPENKKMSDRNINFGTFDLETFKDVDGLAKVYALGFFTRIDSTPKLFYLSDFPNLDSEQLILKSIDEMLTNKYNNYIFYVHNLAHYDIVFIYNVLLKSNLSRILFCLENCNLTH